MQQTTESRKRKPVLLNENNITAFLDENDTLLCDCDGVIWTPSKIIPFAKEAVDCFKDAKKKVLFVTNNSLQSPLPRFEKLGYSVQEHDVAYPPLAVAQHLRSIGLTKKAFVVAHEHFKDRLRNQGITVVPAKKEGARLVKEDILALLSGIQDDSDIGAVVIDVDFNLCYDDLVKAANHLRRPDCLFFVGASDSKVCLESGKVLLGPGYFVSMLEDCTGRKAEVIGKPGRLMIDGYLKKFHAMDMKRTVFVGDTLVQDMGLAHACGMKKLLVLTGMAKLEDLDSCDSDLIPDYYINSFGDFYHLLNKK
ncbi:glycerol-3-phosphate phosphatase isoform X2 [Frankliniella occidentalis]|uniref:Glycerol-3-phosphate phosphatase isoform X2 n=1 Tax=Frankliniella occidentalis TaxID=133901 RepID=A0A9C6XCH9_FRAOC|nr:glycerol-3-phosphate phosphatase isoform X2 [Frankliniella occidentalis]